MSLLGTARSDIEKTVKRHHARVMDKRRARSGGGLVRMVEQTHLESAQRDD